MNIQFSNKDSSDSLDIHINAYEGDNIYDFDNNILLNWYPQRIIHLTAGKSSLLELGLGHGFSTKKFSQTYSPHVVVEGSPAVIKKFRIHNPNCPVQIDESLFENYSTNNRFDVIVIGFVLEHVEDPVLILKRFSQFLAKDGRIFVAVPNAEVLNRRVGKIMGLIDDITKPSENDLMLGHRRYYTVSTLRTDLLRAGYEVAQIEGIYLKPLSTRQMLSLNLAPAAIDALCHVGIGYPELSCGLLVEARLL